MTQDIQVNIGNDMTSQTNIGKIICVGRNYVAHAKELGNEIPEQAVLFMKPASAVVSADNPIVLSDFGGDTHFEAELCVQVKQDLYNATLEEVQQAVGAITLGLDLTLRDLQNELKAKGYPWERSKAFAGSCVLAEWVTIDDIHPDLQDLSKLQFQLEINGDLRQQGDTSMMLFSIYHILMDVSQAFGLQAGDVIMTGTPSGVGKLNSGDQLRLTLSNGEVPLVWQTSVT